MKTRILTCVVVLTLIAIGLGRGVRSYAQEGGDGPPAIGSPVAIIGVEGTEIAQITVTEVEDPFEDFDENSPPDVSNRYVLVHLEVENTGARPYTANAYGVSLQDADGFLYLQTYLFRTEEQIAADPDFPTEEIAPGDSARGVVAFQVLESADLVRVVYQPTYDRLLFLADLTQEGAAPPAGADEDVATPDSDDEDDAGDAGAQDDTAGTDDSDGADSADPDENGADDADAGADDAGADTASEDSTSDDGGDVASIDVSSGDCDDIEEWLDTVTPELDVLSDTLNDVFADDPISVETLEDAVADLEEAADNVRDSDPPALMEESADLLAEALDGYASIYQEAADAGEEISPEDFFTIYDTSEADELLDEIGTIADPILEACGIDA